MSGPSVIYWNPPTPEADPDLARANAVLAALSAELEFSPPLQFINELRNRVVVPGTPPPETRDALDRAAPDWQAVGVRVSG